MKKKIAGGVAVSLLTGGLLFGVSTPANAANCDAGIWSFSSSISIFTIRPDPCALVQARMYRVYGGNLQTLLGAQSSVASQVNSSNGTNAGNYTRKKPSGASWRAWISVPT